MSVKRDICERQQRRQQQDKQEIEAAHRPIVNFKRCYSSLLLLFLFCSACVCCYIVLNRLNNVRFCTFLCSVIVFFFGRHLLSLVSIFTLSTLYTNTHSVKPIVLPFSNLFASVLLHSLDFSLFFPDVVVVVVATQSVGL